MTTTFAPSTSKPTDPRPAYPAAVPTAAGHQPPSHLAATAADLSSDYAARRAALERQKSALTEEETSLRRLFFDESVAQLKAIVTAFTRQGRGFSRARRGRTAFTGRGAVGSVNELRQISGSNQRIQHQDHAQNEQNDEAPKELGP